MPSPDQLIRGMRRARPGAAAAGYPVPFSDGKERFDLAVRIRLTRVGARNNPIWRVVAADQRSPRDGRFIEVLGHYNPQTDPSTIEIDEERVRNWLAQGAQPTRHGQAAAEGEGDPRLKELLEFLARRWSTSPTRSRCDEYEEDDETVVLELSVAEEDRGKVIGRQGRTVKALRGDHEGRWHQGGKAVLVEVVD